MEFDCSPKIGEVMDHHPTALVIAKHTVAKQSDMNEYIVLCAWNLGSPQGVEYVVWTMYARQDEWMVEGGSYFRPEGDKVAFLRAVNKYAARSGLDREMSIHA